MCNVSSSSLISFVCWFMNGIYDWICLLNSQSFPDEISKKFSTEKLSSMSTQSPQVELTEEINSFLHFSAPVPTQKDHQPLEQI